MIIFLLGLLDATSAQRLSVKKGIWTNTDEHIRVKSLMYVIYVDQGIPGRVNSCSTLDVCILTNDPFNVHFVLKTFNEEISFENTKEYTQTPDLMDASFVERLSLQGIK